MTLLEGIVSGLLHGLVTALGTVLALVLLYLFSQVQEAVDYFRDRPY